MSKFERRNTIVELDIEGNIFYVDFGRDGILAIIEDTAQKVSEAEKGHKEIKDTKKRMAANESDGKTIVKEAINDLLQDENASEKIFAKDNTTAFIADVYNFINKEFCDTMGR